MYISYRCKCGKEFVLISEDVKGFNGYLVCPFCSSQYIKRQKENDSLKECMKERSYKRVKGALRQK